MIMQITAINLEDFKRLENVAESMGIDPKDSYGIHLKFLSDDMVEINVDTPMNKGIPSNSNWTVTAIGINKKTHNIHGNVFGISLRGFIKSASALTIYVEYFVTDISTENTMIYLHNSN